MKQLEIDLKNTENKIITLVCDLYDNPLVEIWLTLLKNNLEEKKYLKKHACFLGWVNNVSRTWENLCKEINDNLLKLHSLFPNQIELIQIKNDNFDSSFFNYTHQIFAELLGFHDNVSQIFKNSDINGRWEIVKLNHLSHELQAYVENKKHEQKGLIRPFLNCYFYHGQTQILPLELNNYFTIGNKWGEIYLGSIDVGKNYYDAFNDNDQDIDENHIIEHSVATGEFNIHFSEYSFKKDRMNNFENWLKSKNININDSNVRIGTGKIGIFKCIKNYENLERVDILNLIALYDDIFKIKIKDNDVVIAENTYRYTRKQPTIEIEQLA